MGRGRPRRLQGAQHTEGKLYAQIHALADKAPDYDPDPKGKGVNHVELLERAVAYGAREHGISREQFKQCLGWL
jgi:hypothetical protein